MCWQDYQNFCSDVPIQQIPVALNHLEEQVKTERLAQEQRQQKMMEEKEREDASTSAFHFESEADRQKQEEKERELREFGEIYVAFSLSKPSTEYLCHGQIAELEAEVSSQELDKTDTISSKKKDLTNVQTRRTSMERGNSVLGSDIPTRRRNFSRPVTQKISKSGNSTSVPKCTGQAHARNSAAYQAKDGSCGEEMLLSAQTMSENAKLTNAMKQTMMVAN